MKVIFLGTNGWYDSETGNTPSVLIDTVDAYVIFDAGFGLAKAVEFMKEKKPTYLFLSHFHLDHICGLHTLSRLKLSSPLTIFGNKGLKKMFKNIFVHPYAADTKEVGFKINLEELKPGHYSKPLNFECRQLAHIDPTFGYRLKLEGKIISYCSDTKPCENGRLLAENADLLIHECGYGTKNIEDPWGHTSPEEAAELALNADSKLLLLTNFGPNAFDTKSKREEAAVRAQDIFFNTQSAFDGLMIDL